MNVRSEVLITMGLEKLEQYVNMRAMKRILDASFRYRPSFATDVKKTFERLRREQAAEKAAREVKIVELSSAKKANQR
jgi:hypothetical protein